MPPRVIWLFARLAFTGYKIAALSVLYLNGYVRRLWQKGKGIKLRNSPAPFRNLAVLLIHDSAGMQGIAGLASSRDQDPTNARRKE